MGEGGSLAAVRGGPLAWELCAGPFWGRVERSGVCHAPFTHALPVFPSRDAHVDTRAEPKRTRGDVEEKWGGCPRPQLELGQPKTEIEHPAIFVLSVAPTSPTYPPVRYVLPQAEVTDPRLQHIACGALCASQRNA